MFECYSLTAVWEVMTTAQTKHEGGVVWESQVLRGSDPKHWSPRQEKLLANVMLNMRENMSVKRQEEGNPVKQIGETTKSRHGVNVKSSVWDLPYLKYLAKKRY